MTLYTYRFRLYPTPQQEEQLSKQFGNCRFVYNHFLERKNKLYAETKKGSSLFDDQKQLAAVREQFPFLNDTAVSVLRGALENLDCAFKRFFKKLSAYPKFHSKNDPRQSLRLTAKPKIVGDLLFIPLIKEGFKIRLHRKMDADKFKTASVVRNAFGQYHVAILVERVILPLSQNENKVGIDLGISNLATCSNGVVYENIKPYKTLQTRLARLQREFCRRKKGSKSRERTRRKIAKLHQRIANIRNDHLHKISHSITRDNQTIFLEDLNIAGMMKNRRLAKSIADVSLSELVRQIEYKAKWRGRTVLKVGRFFPSSKLCSHCGFVFKDMTLSDRKWVCPECKVEHDRDKNASVNILVEGNKTVGATGLAGGEDVRPS